jgi:hypothetical protein
MAWTLMSDMKPPLDEEVLFVWVDGIRRIGYLTKYTEEVCCRLGFGNADACIYSPHDYQPTHWMPLPDPPKMEE